MLKIFTHFAWNYASITYFAHLKNVLKNYEHKQV